MKNIKNDLIDKVKNEMRKNFNKEIENGKKLSMEEL
jgi:hypothetical protein